MSLGYNVVEVRHRLKREFTGASKAEIMSMVKREGREAINETYDQRLFSYGGDSVPIKPDYISDTDVLCHDTTFLDDEDRKEYKHATLAEAIEVARAARVKKELICLHISTRYKSKVREIANASGRYEGLDFKVTLIPPGRITTIE